MTAAGHWVRMSAWHRRFEDPGLSILVGILLIVEFVLTPAQATGLIPARVEVILGAAGLFVGALCVARTRTIALLVFLVAAVTSCLTLGRALIGTEIVFGVQLVGRLALLGITLGVVSVSVFAPGRVTLHRVLGGGRDLPAARAHLRYRILAHRPVSSRRVSRRRTDRGEHPRSIKPILQLCLPDIGWLRRYRSSSPRGAQPCQPSRRDWAALSSDDHRTAGDIALVSAAGMTLGIEFSPARMASPSRPCPRRNA